MSYKHTLAVKFRAYQMLDTQRLNECVQVVYQKGV